jgi:hypothetical protein
MRIGRRARVLVGNWQTDLKGGISGVIRHASLPDVAPS